MTAMWIGTECRQGQMNMALSQPSLDFRGCCCTVCKVFRKCLRIIGREGNILEELLNNQSHFDSHFSWQVMDKHLSGFIFLISVMSHKSLFTLDSLEYCVHGWWQILCEGSSWKYLSLQSTLWATCCFFEKSQSLATTRGLMKKVNMPKLAASLHSSIFLHMGIDHKLKPYIDMFNNEKST